MSCCRSCSSSCIMYLHKSVNCAAMSLGIFHHLSGALHLLFLRGVAQNLHGLISSAQTSTLRYTRITQPVCCTMGLQLFCSLIVRVPDSSCWSRARASLFRSGQSSKGAHCSRHMLLCRSSAEATLRPAHKPAFGSQLKLASASVWFQSGAF